MVIRSMVPRARYSRLLLAGVVAAVLAGCGGGSEQTTADYGLPRNISVTKIALSEKTPAPVVGGSPVYFDGGVCGGGNGPLRARWTYDSTEGPAGVRTFPVPDDPKEPVVHAVRVWCLDASGNSAKYALDTLDVTVYAPGTAP